jgi:hypothetical protein
VELIDCIGLEDIVQIEEQIFRYNRLANPYQAKPFSVIKRKAALPTVAFRKGDLFFGAGVFMDTAAWLVREESTTEANAEG